MSLAHVVSVAIVGAALAALLGLVWPWWVVLLAEVVVAAGSAWATYTLHEKRASRPAAAPDALGATVVLQEALEAHVAAAADRMTDSEFRAHFNETPLLLWLTDANPSITDMEGEQFLETVGASRAHWVGNYLPEPWRSQGFAPAMEGRRVPFVSVEPYRKDRDQLVEYLARYDHLGRIVGSKGVAWVAPKGWRIRLYREDGTEVPRIE